MHVIESKTGIDIYGLPAGRYVLDDMNAGDAMTYAVRGDLTVNHFPSDFKKFDETKEWNGKKVLLVRPGGYGDLLFLMCSVEEMKRRWPSIEVHISAYGRYQSILKTSPIEKIIPYPVKESALFEYDAVVFMENCVEGSEKAERDHIVDVMAEHIGLSSVANKKCSYVFTPDETDWAAKRYARTAKKRIGIQLSASGKARSYPPALMLELIMRLANAKHEVYLLGGPKELPKPLPDPIRNLTLEGLDFRQSVAAMATCDVVVGPDSVMVHVAGALDIPAVALYGPFPWTIRTKYHPSVQAIQGHSGCNLAPCFYHGSRVSLHFPTNGPCAKTGKCEVMGSIKVDRIITAINSQLNKK